MKFLFPLLAPIVEDKGDLEVIEEKPIAKAPKADDDTAILDNLIGDKDLLDMDEREKVIEEKEEDVLDEVEPEKEDIIESARGIDLAKVKEKYPDFAKTNEFRELRNAYFRESKFSELFPTIEDAKEAAENNDTFVKLNDDIINKGDATSLLESVKNASPESLKKLTSSFLDKVYALDETLYIEAVKPVFRGLAKQIYNEGQKALKRNAESEDGKALVWTARNIMQYVFQDADEVTKDEPRADPKISEKEKELSEREQAIARDKFTSAYNTCDTSVERHLDKAILEGLDPDGKLNEFTRDTLVEKIKNEIKAQISKDNLHLKRMGSLWKRAEQQGFSRESLSSIVTAYLERARPVIPTVRNKFRSMAIKDRVTKDDDENSREESPKLVSRGRSGRAPANDGKVNLKIADTRKIDYNKTSDDDIFNGKVSLKG